MGTYLPNNLLKEKYCSKIIAHFVVYLNREPHELFDHIRIDCDEFEKFSRALKLFYDFKMIDEVTFSTYAELLLKKLIYFFERDTLNFKSNFDKLTDWARQGLIPISTFQAFIGGLMLLLPADLAEDVKDQIVFKIVEALCFLSGSSLMIKNYLQELSENFPHQYLEKLTTTLQGHYEPPTIQKVLILDILHNALIKRYYEAGKPYYMLAFKHLLELSKQFRDFSLLHYHVLVNVESELTYNQVAEVINLIKNTILPAISAPINASGQEVAKNHIDDLRRELLNGHRLTKEDKSLPVILRENNQLKGNDLPSMFNSLAARLASPCFQLFCLLDEFRKKIEKAIGDSNGSFLLFISQESYSPKFKEVLHRATEFFERLRPNLQAINTSKPTDDNLHHVSLCFQALADFSTNIASDLDDSKTLDKQLLSFVVSVKEVCAYHKLRLEDTTIGETKLNGITPC